MKDELINTYPEIIKMINNSLGVNCEVDQSLNMQAQSCFIKHDCIYYNSFRDMNASLDLCEFKTDGKMHSCTCRDCKWYVDIYTARKFMKEKRYIELVEKGYVINKEEIL